MTKCVVLRSSCKCTEEKVSVLRGILDLEPDLFAVVGVDCASWEDAMDELCIRLDQSGEKPGAFCNTTSHPDESLPEVIAFAEQWCDLKGWSRDVAIVDI